MKVSDKNIAVFGAVFGDESKARVTNYFSKSYRYTVRFGGSSNAGCTFYYKGKKVVRHLIPAADFSIIENKAFLGSGMVINPDELLSEIKETIDTYSDSSLKVGERIIIDPDAFVIKQEYLEEDKNNIKSFGSTGKGVSVAYRDKIYRKGTKILDLIKDSDPVILKLKELGVQFKFAHELYDDFIKSSILYQGVQAVMLDINAGTYPYVTSGDCTAGGIFNSGFGFAMPSKIYGVAKCYSSRVGEGPFPTELFGNEAEHLRKIGAEFGATTGRPRRVGWLVLPMLKYAIKRASITDLVLTKLDVLESYGEIKLCTRYSNLDRDPASGSDFFNVIPEYKSFNSWDSRESIDDYLKYIEDYIGINISYFTYGLSDKDFMART